MCVKFFETDGKIFLSYELIWSFKNDFVDVRWRSDYILSFSAWLNGFCDSIPLLYRLTRTHIARELL